VCSLARLLLAASCAAACTSEATPAINGDSVAHTATQTGAMTGASAGTGISVGGAAGQAAPPAAVSGSAGTTATTPAARGTGGSSAGTAAGSGGAAAGSGGGAAGASGASGSGGITAAGSGGAGGAVGAADTGTLPAVMDPSVTGHFTPAETDKTGPDGNYTIIAPKELGEGGVKHPILVWGPGAGAWPGIYQTLLNHIASHGFFIISYNSTPQGPELTKAMDWIIAEGARQGSMYFGKLDTMKIAAAGQSAGSLAVFKIANDPRLTTTLHINGGTFAPHTDVMNLVKPAQFICGDDPSVTGGDGTSVSDEARPNCDVDFMNAKTPVWYGDVIGASHTTVIDNPLSPRKGADVELIKQFLGATAAWLRWQLADDQVMKALFIGPSCGYCSQPMAWKVQQKNL
jgi:hypothetical protein